MVAKKFVAVLDTMWGATGSAPRYFTINPRNHSGRRLYWLTGCALRDLLVVNACPQQTSHALKHGTPSEEWLKESLAALPREFRRATLLVCGKVAQQTFDNAGVVWRGPVLCMDHPAARRWSRAKLDSARRKIARIQ